VFVPPVFEAWGPPQAWGPRQIANLKISSAKKLAGHEEPLEEQQNFH